MVEVACQTDYVCIVETEPNSEGEEKVRIIEKVVVPEYIKINQKKYFEKNREKITEKVKERYKEKYHSDPIFREKEIEKAKERNKKRRERLKMEKVEK